MFKLARSNFNKVVKNPYYKTSNFLFDYLKIFKEDEEVFNMLKKLYMNELSYATHEIEYGLLLSETEFDDLFLEIDLFERYFKDGIYYDNGHFIRTVNEYRKMIEEYTNREKVKLKDIQL